jgi:small-conductance mechanosensitive channel
VARVIALLEDAARSVPGVLNEPRPMAALLGFIADGLEIELGFWIVNPEAKKLEIQSSVAQRVLGGLRGAGIDIALPRRELRIESWSPPRSQ